VVDPAPPPICTYGSTDDLLGYPIDASGSWIDGGENLAASITLEILHEWASPSLSQDPTITGGTLFRIDRHDTGISFLLVPEVGAASAEVQLPVQCQDASRILRITIDLTDPVLGDAVHISGSTSDNP